MFSKLRQYVLAHKIEIVLLLMILLVSAYFRLYRISDYMTFLGDEGRDAIIAKDILRGDFTLLGPRASAGDFFLGPIYYYMMAPFLLLTGLDPVGPAIMVALIGIATVFLVYYVGLRLLNNKAALVAAALYAISPLVVSYSRSSWNPNPMPFFSLLMLYVLYVGIKNQSLKLFATTGFLLGIAMQLHYLSTFLAVIIFFIVLVGEYIASKKLLLKRYVIHFAMLFGGFALGLSPFIAFEVRHGFPNTKTIFSFIFSGNASDEYVGTSFIGNVVSVFFRLFARLLMKFPPPEQVNVTINLDLQILQVLTYILAFASIFFVFKVKGTLTKVLLIAWLFLGVVLFGFYKKSIYDYYLGFLFPLPFLLVGNLVYQLGTIVKYKKVWMAASLILFVGLLLLNFSGRPFQFPPNKQKDQAKGIATFVLSKTNNKPFNFALLTRGNSDHVYRYFFEVAGRSPVSIENPSVDPERKTVTDQLLVVCEYSECQPIGNPLWEVAGFGRAEIAGQWTTSFVKVFRLVHYTRPEGYRLSQINIDTTYENSDLGITFKYPETFSIHTITNEKSYESLNPTLVLQLKTPDVSDATRKRADFNVNVYDQNTMNMYVVVYPHDGMGVKDMLEHRYASMLKDSELSDSSTPKEGSVVFERKSEGEKIQKSYFFINQNHFYEVTLTGGNNDAERIFDDMVKSISFK